jgi:hypothetical protein
MSPWHLYCQLGQEGEGISFRRVGVPGGRCRLAGIEVLMGREQRGHRLHPSPGYHSGPGDVFRLGNLTPQKWSIQKSKNGSESKWIQMDLNQALDNSSDSSGSFKRSRSFFCRPNGRCISECCDPHRHIQGETPPLQEPRRKRVGRFPYNEFVSTKTRYDPVMIL